MGEGGVGIRAVSVFFPQFCFELKTAANKIKYYEKKKKRQKRKRREQQ